MSKSSPFQVFVETWYTNPTPSKLQEISRIWSRMSKSEKSYYIKAFQSNKPVDKNAKIFKV